MSEIVDYVYLVLDLIRKACQDPCARNVCEELEDALLVLLDEAGDPDNITLYSVRAIEYAIDELRRAEQKVSEKKCGHVLALFSEARRHLERALALVSRLWVMLLHDRRENADEYDKGEEV
jgi:hypothetical protein